MNNNDTTCSSFNSVEPMKPYRRECLTSEKKTWTMKLRAIVGLTFVTCLFYLWLIALIFFIYGNLIIRSLIILLLVYQYFIVEDRNETYRNFIKNTAWQNYFDKYTLIVEEKPEESNSLFCSHPHGIMSIAMGVALQADVPGLSTSIPAGTRFVRLLPVSGIFARLSGIQRVDNRHFKEMMKEGKNICFIPGGFECATLTNHRQDTVFINIRKGFIKYALQMGYKIHPCYGFNENRIYYTFNYFQKFRMLLNKIKFPGCLFIGKFFILPRDDLHLGTVIGKPVILPKIPHPTKEDIDKYHGIYVEALRSLYDRYKSEFETSDVLEIY